MQQRIAIGACDPDGVMGCKGKLPWSCPEDLRHFAETVKGFPLIMGYRTYLGLPDSYFDRPVYVFTRHKRVSRMGEIFVASPEALFALVETEPVLYIIGGSEIFTLFLRKGWIDLFLLTKMRRRYAGDVLLPLSLLQDWPRTLVRSQKDFEIICFSAPHR